MASAQRHREGIRRGACTARSFRQRAEISHRRFDGFRVYRRGGYSGEFFEFFGAAGIFKRFRRDASDMSHRIGADPAPAELILYRPHPGDLSILEHARQQASHRVTSLRNCVNAGLAIGRTRAIFLRCRVPDRSILKRKISRTAIQERPQNPARIITRSFCLHQS